MFDDIYEPAPLLSFLGVDLFVPFIFTLTPGALFPFCYLVCFTFWSGGSLFFC